MFYYNPFRRYEGNLSEQRFGRRNLDDSINSLDSRLEGHSSSELLYVKDESGHLSKVSSYNPEKKFDVINVFDYDGTIRKYSTFATVFHNLLIPSSVNSLGLNRKMIFQELSKALSVLSRFSKTDYYKDTTTIAEDMHEIGLNVVYTLNTIENTEKFLRRKNILKHFDAIISPQHKDADSLYSSLSVLTEREFDDLFRTPIFAFGDNRCDIEAMDFEDSHSESTIRVGFESGLEKKLEIFKKECDIFIPEELRPTDSVALFYYAVTEKMKKNPGLFSAREDSKTDIFKYINELYLKHAEKD